MESERGGPEPPRPDPPGGWLPPAAPPPPPYQPPPVQPYWPQTVYWQQEPGNTPAMVGFIMSVASISTLVFFIGILSPLNLAVSIASTIVSRNGQKKVDRGETRQSRDLATWGFWLGIAGIVLSLIAIAIWIAIIVASPHIFDDNTTPHGEPALLA